MRARVVDDHEATAAWAGDKRNGHPEGARCRDGGVNGVAAPPKHVDAGPAGAEVHRGDGTPGPDSDRLVRIAGIALGAGRAGWYRGTGGGA